MVYYIRAYKLVGVHEQNGKNMPIKERKKRSGAPNEQMHDMYKFKVNAVIFIW